jgi:diguanylate cyclase (GGDEF)-like protein/PAS domain S-box-containing protein
MRENQTLPLKDALQTLLWKRLLLPFLAAAFVVMSVTAFYGGRFALSQQLRYSQLIGRTASSFLLDAAYRLDEINAVVSTGSLEEVTRNMQANLKFNAVFETIYFLDSEKRIKTLAPYDSRYGGLDMSRRSYFSGLDCGAGVNFSIPFTSLRTGRPTAYLTRCTDTGEYLVGELDLNALQDTISEAYHSSQGRVYMVDQTGTLLAHPDFQLVAERINIGNLAIVRRGLQQDLTLIYWHDTGFWVGSASRVDPTGWIIIVEVPLLTVYAPYIGAILFMSLLFVLIFTLAVRAFSQQLKRKLVSPLVYLSVSAAALQRGDYAPSDLKLDDTIPFMEISGLLTNFKNMRRAIIGRETQLKESEEQYRRLIEFSPNAILLHSNSVIVYANAAAVALYHASSVNDLTGKLLLELVHPDSQAMVSARLQKLHEKEQLLPLVEQKHVRLDGGIFQAETVTSSIMFAGNYVLQTIVRDITQRKEEEAALKYRATHDPLTDLPNRFLFDDRLKHALAHSRRSGLRGAVLYLDIDNFKSINDSFGHNVGDDALRLAAGSLRRAVREDDTVARLGGDEFVVLLENLGEPLDAEKVVGEVFQAFSRPFVIEGNEIRVSFSIGVSIFPDDGDDPETLLQSADAAMYRAKDEGKQRARFHVPNMRVQSLERIHLQKQLYRALERDQLFLEYQPQIDHSTRGITGLEALLRWRHPDLGLVSPARFIPIAEETGLILPIGEWVLRTAFSQAREWQDAGFNSVRVAVNLSSLQFKQSDIALTIQRMMRDLKVTPSSIEIELMENIVFRDSDASFGNLESLRSTGVSIAMDDFGAGFSTLGYLADIPFDRIKIDQRLVAKIDNPRDAAVVSGIITICNNLNLEVIAEGVETAGQLQFCSSRGCNFFQGWYYSPATTAANVTRYLRGGAPWQG